MNGITLTADIRHDPGSEKREPVIATVGRVSPQYGGSDAVFFSRCEKQVRERINRSNFRERFQLLPWTDEVMSGLAAALAVVFVSTYEGLPFVLLESWLVGTPVITVPAPGLSDVVVNRNSALVATDSTPESIARAVREVLVHPDIADCLRQGARDQLQRQHDAAEMAKGYENFYAELLVATAARPT
jgi:glycosyltransferase involved in cell wall biosynthesis